MNMDNHQLVDRWTIACRAEDCGFQTTADDRGDAVEAALDHDQATGHVGTIHTTPGLGVNDLCCVCETHRDEFECRVILGELTTGDVNMERRKHGRRPICGRSCMMALGYDVLPGVTDLSISPRFSAYERKKREVELNSF